MSQPRGSPKLSEVISQTRLRRFLSCVGIHVRFHQPVVLNRVDLYAIDATPARWRADAGF